MKKLLRILFVVLVAYFLYAFIFSVIIYAFKNPKVEEKCGTFSDSFENQKLKTNDRFN